MSVSTDGQLCFGIMLEEEVLPWDAESLEDVWLDALGFSAESPYDEFGAYKPGYSGDDPRVEEYYAQKSAMLRDNPLPITEVNYCSADCPMMILAVPSSCLTCYRGHPFQIDPAKLIVTNEEVKALLDFCQRFGLSGEPTWWLSSYWG